jgi:predicted secreted protein
MAASSAISSQGTLLQVSDGGGTPVWTSIAELKSISGPEVNREVIDVTHLASDDGAREKIAGNIVIRPVQCEGNLIFDATQLDLWARLADLTDSGGRLSDDIWRTYRVVFPDAVLLANRTKLVFVAAVSSFVPSVQDGAAIGVSISLDVSGDQDFQTT